MKFIREVSDIHLWFDIRGKRQRTMDNLWRPEPIPEDSDTCLAISGDTWESRNALARKHHLTNKSWLASISDQFKYVVFVLGNHDYWRKNVHLEPERVLANLAEQGLSSKVFLLERSTVVLDQVKFVGGTLWTDFHRRDPLVMLDAMQVMNDYHQIRAANWRKVRPEDLITIHDQTRNYIFKNAIRDHVGQKVIVVTHMAPSCESISSYHRNNVSNLNYCYFSDLDYQIADHSSIDIWFHGHIHTAVDYQINNTRIICNPRGCPTEKTGWNPRLRIEL